MSSHGKPRDDARRMKRLRREAELAEKSAAEVEQLNLPSLVEG